MNKNQNLYIGNNMVAKLCDDTTINKLCLGDNVVFYYMENKPIELYINIEFVRGCFWILTGEKTVEGVTYLVYRSNMHEHNNWTTAKITFFGVPDFSVAYGSYAESYYDYLILSELDADILDRMPSLGLGLFNTYGNQSSEYPNMVATYPNDGGEHHIYVYFRKDSSVSKGDDSGAFGVIFGTAPTPPTPPAPEDVEYYKVRLADFVSEGDNYYLPDKRVVGIAVRTDYVYSYGPHDCDMYYPHEPEWTSVTPRMSLSYNGGVYTDYSFTDRRLRDIRDVQYIDGYPYVYYMFENQEQNYRARIANVHWPYASDFEQYMILLIKKD